MVHLCSICEQYKGLASLSTGIFNPRSNYKSEIKSIHLRAKYKFGRFNGNNSTYNMVHLCSICEQYKGLASLSNGVLADICL